MSTALHHIVSLCHIPLVVMIIVIHVIDFKYTHDGACSFVHSTYTAHALCAIEDHR